MQGCNAITAGRRKGTTDSFNPAIFNCVPQDIFKHAIPDYLVRGTDLSLRLSNEKMAIANTIAILCELIKIILIFLSEQHYIYTHVHTHGQAQVTPLFLLQTFITKS